MAAEDLGFSSDRLERIAAFTHRYVDEGRLPGVHTLVTRDGQVVHEDVYGFADVEAGRKLEPDAIYRIYSMTKPIASLALMQCYEDGLCLLEDPVSRYLPNFAEMRVWAGGTLDAPVTEPVRNPVTIRHLLTHTSGLVSGFQPMHLAELYYMRQTGGTDLARGRRASRTLAEWADELHRYPLMFEPGTRWHYSFATDVVGRLVEVLSGMPLDEYIAERITGPLGMVDTGFWVPDDKADRFTACYMRMSSDQKMVRTDGTDAESPYRSPPRFLSGAGGMVSTAADYARFTSMLLAGGTLDGERIIGRRILEYMTVNHLPGGRLLNDLGQSTFTEVAMDGVGFGLGFSVVVDPAATQVPTSVGSFAWGGAASTIFWVDPAERLCAHLFTQLLPSAAYPLRRQLQVAVYQALL